MPWKNDIVQLQPQRRTEVISSVADICNDVVIVFVRFLSPVFVEDLSLAEIARTQLAPVLMVIRLQVESTGG